MTQRDLSDTMRPAIAADALNGSCVRRLMQISRMLDGIRCDLRDVDPEVTLMVYEAEARLTKAARMIDPRRADYWRVEARQ